MRAGAYQKSEPAKCCMGGPETPSITSDGWEGASTAKKKSGPRPAQAVPSLRSLASKLAEIASRRPPLLDLARSISCGADLFSAAKAEAIRQIDSNTSLPIRSLIYSGTTVFQTGPGTGALPLLKHEPRQTRGSSNQESEAPSSAVQYFGERTTVNRCGAWKFGVEASSPRVALNSEGWTCGST